MKIIAVCMRYDYGDSTRGDSFEYVNIVEPLVQLGHDVTLYDFVGLTQQAGRNAMNTELVQLVNKSKPDVVLFSLYKNDFDPETLQHIRNYARTLCFFYDDTWRTQYTQYWAPRFDYFTTASPYGVEYYNKMGLDHALHFPFGCNDKIYHKTDLPKLYDISFVGLRHPHREWLINRLRARGLSVRVRGYGWPEGKASHAEMVRMINQSKINLNLSNSVCWDMRYLGSSWRACFNSLRSKKVGEQVKARHFEINGCGGFQLSFYVEGIEHYYTIGQEIAIFSSPSVLERQVEHYLFNDRERERIAQAGYNRTVQEHLLSNRLQKLLEQIK